MALQILLPMWKLTRGIRLGLVGNVFLGMLSVAMTLVAVWITHEIVAAACSADMVRLKSMSVCLCLAMLLRLLSSKSARRFEAWCISHFSNQARSQLFAVIMDGRYDGEEKLHSADIVNRLSADVGTVSSAVCSTLPAFIVSGVSLIGSFLFLVSIAPTVAVVVTALMPVAIAAGKFSMSRSHRLTKEIRKEESGIYQSMQENISHRLIVETLGYVDSAKENFNRSQNRFFNLTMRRNDLSLWSSGALMFGFMAGYAVIFIYCAYGLVDGSVTFATMTALLQLVAMVQNPIVDLSKKLSPMVRAHVAMARINDIESLYGGKQTVPIKVSDEMEIRFERVWFRYNSDSEYVLKDFSASIPFGKTTTIYGATGSGKTTLFKLLLGLYVPEGGYICSPFPLVIDNMIYVPQGNSLMTGTIKSNLVMGRPDADMSEIAEALYVAAADFVDEMPERLMTRCGESGEGLSEGQAQRLAIARGVLRLMSLRERGISPILFLMDEPTSALDAETERTLCERLIPYLKGTTVIIITHKETPGNYSAKTIHLGM